MIYPILIIKNPKDITGVLYTKGWRQLLHLPGELEHPEYTYEETGEQNSEGKFIAHYKVWRKEMRIAIMAHEPLYLALEAAAMCDQLELLDAQGNRHKIKTMSVTMDWADKSIGKATIKMVVAQEDWRNIALYEDTGVVRPVVS